MVLRMANITIRKYLVFFFIIFLSLPIYGHNEKIALKAGQSFSSQIKTKDTEYIIENDYDLKGGTIVLPDNVSLRFAGGKLKNGVLELKRETRIFADGFVFDNVELRSSKSITGDYKLLIPELEVVWFGAKGDASTDDTESLQVALRSAHNLGIPLVFNRGNYIIKDKLVLNEGDAIIGKDNSIVNLNNQRHLTIIKYEGQGDAVIEVNGRFVRIENMIIAGKTNSGNTINGIVSHGSLMYLSCKNVLLTNLRYGISATLGQAEGFSQCIFDYVRIQNCIRGLSVDMQKKQKGQYITFNRFYDCMISGMKETGIFLHSRAINTNSFYNCDIDNVGYGNAFDKNMRNNSIYGVYIDNEGIQGNTSFTGCYFENIYYSSDGSLVAGYEYGNNAVIGIRNINLSITNSRFANTRTIVCSKGYDNISLENCLDNGFLANEGKDLWLINNNTNTTVNIDGYNFINKDKDIIRNSSSSIVTTKNVRLRNHSVLH